MGEKDLDGLVAFLGTRVAGKEKSIRVGSEKRVVVGGSQVVNACAEIGGRP